MKIDLKVEKPEGTYICVVPDGDSAHHLVRDMFRTKQLPQTSRGSLHVTLMYDADTPFGTYPVPEFDSCTAYVKKVVVLGDDDNIAALELDCPELHDYHRRLKDAGYTHSFDDFLPHISVMKNFTAQQLRALKDVFNNSDYPVKLNYAKTTPLRP